MGRPSSVAAGEVSGRGERGRARPGPRRTPGARKSRARATMAGSLLVPLRPCVVVGAVRNWIGLVLLTLHSTVRAPGCRTALELKG